MELATDFDEFIASLTAHGVEFVVVGAHAFAFHGAPRFTGDLEILLRPSLENAARVPARPRSSRRTDRRQRPSAAGLPRGERDRGLTDRSWIGPTTTPNLQLL